jgi:GxxExxY protein
MKENHYQRVLAYYLQNKGINVSLEEIVKYQFKNIYAGFGRMDIVCRIAGKKYILELKVGGHGKVAEYMQQLRKYMQFEQCTAGFVIIFDSSLFPKIYQENSKTCSPNGTLSLVP